MIGQIVVPYVLALGTSHPLICQSLYAHLLDYVDLMNGGNRDDEGNLDCLIRCKLGRHTLNICLLLNEV